MTAALDQAVDLAAIERFLYREAMLLDEKRWPEWLALYSEDCFYWAPSVVGHKTLVDTISLYAEDRMRLEMRIIRVTHPHAYSQDFPTRMSHVVGNVMLDPEGGKQVRWRPRAQGPPAVRSTVHSSSSSARRSSVSSAARCGTGCAAPATISASS